MTTNETLPRPLTPRRLYAGLWVVAALLYGALITLGRPFLAVGAFVGVGLLAVAYYARAPQPMFDERDRVRRQEAAARTFQVLGMASAVFFPTVVVLWGLGYHTWPPWLFYLGTYAGALFVLYGLVTALVDWQG